MKAISRGAYHDRIDTPENPFGYSSLELVSRLHTDMRWSSVRIHTPSDSFVMGSHLARRMHYMQGIGNIMPRNGRHVRQLGHRCCSVA